ncbi:MAG TPA: zinc-binding dehydrogenase [Solirubrobacteraceae bacterium]|jgi:L-iditol 2-dehydrogenase|nr:zinc-binding dehydrogenase [Solirubrobacteraceae bacterium]
MLHGPGDLRVEEVAEPAGEVVVHVEAATTCATDVKCLCHGHLILGPYPARFGHETVGRREDSGERVLVGDSVACGTCPPCAAGRAQLCERMTWVLGGFAERIAAPAAALHSVPDGLDPAGAAMAEPLAAAVHAIARSGAEPGAGTAVLGGGTMGLMLARLLVLRGCDVTLADRHPERRAQAEAFGAAAVEQLGSHDIVLEAVGRPEAWQAALAAAAPGATVVFVGGCPAGSDVTLPAAPLHYAELDVRGAFHHDRAEVEEALALLAAGDVDWRALAGETVGLDALHGALVRPASGEARKLVVDPRL